MKYLFWNTYKNKNINSILCDLIVENEISVVVLAEYSANVDELLDLLRIEGFSMREIPSMCERIRIIGASGISIEPHLQTDKASIQIINNNIILCGVHLNSQIYSANEDAREIYIERIICDILSEEKELCTKKTIIVGDLNINPYDEGCLSARYFHGIPIFEETTRESRTISGKEFYMFYNPMWNFLGDFKEPYGTYYHNSSNAINSYWNVYDQVIIRPILRKQFIDDSLKILTKTTKNSLLDKKKHPNCEISDHLPITFEIKEDQNE